MKEISEEIRQMLSEIKEPRPLKVWWKPQIQMKVSFEYKVNTLLEGVLLLEVLAQYDLYQYDNNVKPDYCNVGGLLVYEQDSDREGTPGWVDWVDEETGDFIDDHIGRLHEDKD